MARPLILPGAFDALSARLIRQAGFKAYFTGGFPTIGARWGLPDIGLVALGEIASAVTDFFTDTAGVRGSGSGSDGPLADCCKAV
jgi:2-methylisocitrate lyase-like PEP mutase family enzyme